MSAGGKRALSEDRRRSPRVSVDTQVLQVEDGSGQVDIALGQTRDVSLHGLYVLVKRQFNPAQDPEAAEVMRLRFRLPGGSEPIEATGRIARVDRDPAGDKILGFGMEFTELPAASRAALEAFVSAQHPA